MREVYTVTKCRCGHPVCKDYHVWPVAALQGVKFTEDQANAVAKLLNAMEATTSTGDTDGQSNEGSTQG